MDHEAQTTAEVRSALLSSSCVVSIGRREPATTQDDDEASYNICFVFSSLLENVDLGLSGHVIETYIFTCVVRRESSVFPTTHGEPSVFPIQPPTVITRYSYFIFQMLILIFYGSEPVTRVEKASFHVYRVSEFVANLVFVICCSFCRHRFILPGRLKKFQGFSMPRDFPTRHRCHVDFRRKRERERDFYCGRS